MSKIYFIFLLSIFYSQDCYHVWQTKHLEELSDKVIEIIATISNNNAFNDVNCYIDKTNRIKINYLDKIIISDSTRIRSYSKSTNQLIIENSDIFFNNFIFSFFNTDSIPVLQDIDQKHYKIKSPYGSINIYMKNSCDSIDSLSINIENKKIIISDIRINLIDSIFADSLFNFNFGKKEVFK